MSHLLCSSVTHLHLGKNLPPPARWFVWCSRNLDVIVVAEVPVRAVPSIQIELCAKYERTHTSMDCGSDWEELGQSPSRRFRELKGPTPGLGWCFIGFVFARVFFFFESK